MNHWSDDAFRKIRDNGFAYAVRPHRPNFVTGSDTPEDIFGANSLQEIFNADYIKRWKEEAILVGLETEYYYGAQRLIRACMKDGSHWVIGYFAELKDYPTESSDPKKHP